jgi:hypothetical protein
MNHKILFACFIGFCVLSAMASDTTKTTRIVVDIQKSFREEYCACTGDSMQGNPRVVMAWKRKQNQTVATPLYQDALKRFMKLPDIKKPFLPCDVIAWMNKDKERQTAQERNVTRALLARQDSIDLAAELALNPASAYDFALIPFGLYRETLIELFTMHYPRTSLLNIGSYLYAQKVPWEGRLLTVAFYFNKQDRFYKYALESTNMPADSLNTSVRPYADIFDSVFTRKIGKPGQQGTVAFFDIKDNQLSLCDEWETDRYQVYSGLSRIAYRYYAKAVISSMALDDRKQHQGDKFIVTENGKERHYLSDGPIIP